MKVIIPVKATSRRVPEKNWRPFYKNKSLVDIKIEQVLRAFEPADIFLSCEDFSKKEVADNYGINFILREPSLAIENIPWPQSFTGMIKEIPVNEDEDIFWVEAVNPLFADFISLKSVWLEQKGDHDSLILAAPIKKFIFDAKGHPANFLYGPWHTYSQDLIPYYTWDSVCVMSKKRMLEFGYPIGRNPYFYTFEEPSVDIDTLDEFKIAQLVYESISEK
jgi:N-acylneuraminate cytidylyltransferase